MLALVVTQSPWAYINFTSLTGFISLSPYLILCQYLELKVTEMCSSHETNGHTLVHGVKLDEYVTGPLQLENTVHALL